MVKKRFPTIGRVLKFFVEGLGIRFNESSFLNNTKHSSKDVGNLRRELNKLAQENTLEIKRVESLVKDIIYPLLETVIDNIEMSKPLEMQLKAKILNELGFFIELIFTQYKIIVLNIESYEYREEINIIRLYEFYTNKLAVFSNIVEKSVILNLVKSENEINGWLTDGISNIDSVYEDIFNWWAIESGANSLRELAMRIKKDNDGFYKNLLNWKNNEHQPDLEQILDLLNLPVNATNPNNKNFRVNLVLKLLISRFMVCIKKSLPKEKVKEGIQYFNYVYSKKFKEVEKLGIDELYREIKYIDINDHSFTGFSDFSELDEDVESPFTESYSLARYHIFNFMDDGSKDKAKEYYLKAFDEAKYKVGVFHKSLIEEIIVVSAFLGDFKMLKQVYSWAQSVELFKEEFKETKYWIIWYYKLIFFDYFDIRGFSGIAFQQMAEFKEDVKKLNIFSSDIKLNRWRSEQVRESANDINILDSYFYLSFTQLMKFALSGAYDKVVKALHRGARIYVSNEDNATALHYSLMNGNFDITLCLLKSGKKLAINNITHKDKMSCFDYLIEGINETNKDLVFQILKQMLLKGFDVNMQTSLYYTSSVYTVLQMAFYPDSANYQSVIDNPILDEIAVRDFNTTCNSQDIFTNECLSKYRGDIKKQGKNIFKRGLKLKEISLSILDVILEVENVDFDLRSKSNYTCLLYLARVGDLEYFQKIFERTKDPYYLIKGNNIENHQSIFGNCVLNQNWSILEYYLKNIDLSKLIESDFYLPFYILMIWNSLSDKKETMIKKRIFYRLGTFFPIVLRGAINMKKNEFDSELFALYMKFYRSGISSEFELLDKKDFNQLFKKLYKNIELIQIH